MANETVNVDKKKLMELASCFNQIDSQGYKAKSDDDKFRDNKGFELKYNSAFVRGVELLREMLGE